MTYFPEKKSVGTFINLKEGAPVTACAEAYLSRRLIERFPNLLEGETEVLEEGKVIALDITMSTAIMTNPTLAGLGADLMREFHEKMNALSESSNEFEEFLMLQTAGDERLYYANTSYMGALSFALKAQLAYYKLIQSEQKYLPIKDFYENATREGKAEPPYIHIGLTGLNGKLGKRAYLSLVDMGDRIDLLVGGDLTAKKLATNQLVHEPLIEDDDTMISMRMAILAQLGINIKEIPPREQDTAPTYSFEYGDIHNLENVIDGLEQAREVRRMPNNDGEQNRNFNNEKYTAAAVYAMPTFMRERYRTFPEHFVNGEMPPNTKASALFMEITGIDKLWDQIKDLDRKNSSLPHRILAEIQKEMAQLVSRHMSQDHWNSKEIETDEIGNIKLIYTHGVYEEPEDTGLGITHNQIAPIFYIMGLTENTQTSRYLASKVESYINDSQANVPAETKNKLKRIIEDAHLGIRAGIYTGDGFIISETIQQKDGFTVFSGHDQIKGPGLSTAYRLMDSIPKGKSGIALNLEVATNLGLDTLYQGTKTTQQLKGISDQQEIFLVEH